MRELSLPPDFLSRLPLWLQATLRDRYLWAMLIIALLINLGLFAFLILVSNQLPPLVPLHFDAAGQPDRIEDKSCGFCPSSNWSDYGCLEFSPRRFYLSSRTSGIVSLERHRNRGAVPPLVCRSLYCARSARITTAATR